MRKTEENANASSMLVRCAALLRCLMKYNPTQSAIAHNPFRSALRAGKNIQRPAKLAEAWCTYSSHSRNDTARPLTTTIAPTTGRGLISACSMLTIKAQKSIRKSYRACRKSGNLTSECAVIQEQQSVSASCSFFYLLAVDRPTLGWRQAQDKGIGPMVSDGIQPSAAPEDRPYAPRFRPLPSGGAAAPAFSE